MAEPAVSEEDLRVHVDVEHAPHPVAGKPLPVTNGEVVGGNAEEQPSSDDSSTDGDDEEDSDDESLLQDILNHEDDSSLEDQDIIPQDEARILKARLHQVGPDEFVRETITSGAYTARKLLTAFGVRPPPLFDDYGDYKFYRLLGFAITRELISRQKLPQYNTIDDAVKLLQQSSRIMVITGAGISTNLGVPDFRSKNTGFYDQMREKGYDSPEDIFDLEIFEEDPSVFYENSGPTLPELGKSTPTHAFIKLLEDKGKLLTNYTQNIDDVEGNVGISRDKLIQCHGSWATFTCRKCGFKTDGKQFYADVKAKRVVYCTACPKTLQAAGVKRKRSSKSSSRSKSRNGFDGDDSSDDDGRYDIPQPGVMKPDITFFGEKLPDTFFDRFKKRDRDMVDLVVIIGTSMQVAPVSEIPMAVDPSIPHIYISRDRVKHTDFDIVLLGDCDVVTEELARRVGWAFQHPMLKQRQVRLTEEDHDLAIWRVEPVRPPSPDPEKA